MHGIASKLLTATTSFVLECSPKRLSHLLAVEGSVLPSEALADNFCALIHEYSWLMGLHSNTARLQGVTLNRLCHVGKKTKVMMFWHDMGIILLQCFFVEAFAVSPLRRPPGSASSP